jgi:long-chain acyl-CoA synthetase
MLNNRTVITMLADAKEAYPELPYLLRKGDRGYKGLSFLEAADGAERVASALITRGFSKGDRVAILAEGDPDWVVFELGVVLAGCVSVPLSIKLLPEEIPFRLNHAQTSAILVTKNTAEKFASVRAGLDDPKLLVVYSGDEASLAALVESGSLLPDSSLRFDALVAEGEAARIDASTELAARKSAALEDDTVTICYTSGTTGNPKGIMLTHLNYWSNCHDAVEAFELKHELTTLVILPLDHSFAHTVALYTALVRGNCLAFVDARGGGMAILRNIPQNLKEVRPDFLLTVPSLSGNFMKKICRGVEEKGGLIKAIFDSGLKAGIERNGNGFNKPSFLVRLSRFFPWALANLIVFPSLRKIFGGRLMYCVGGGALLDVKQQEFFKAIGVPIYQGYGLTEAAPIISSNTPRLHKLGSSGMVMKSVTCRILRPDGTECAVGERGEIVIRGDNVMKGYFRNEEASAKALRDGWLFTGDLGYFDSDGFLVVVGREKALLIAEDGEKYSPEEIEEAIVNCSSLVSQVMLYNDHRKYTSALVVVDAARLRSTCADAEAALKAVKDSFYAFRTDPSFASRFPQTWIPTTFLVLTEPFTEQNHMINSSLKLVRHKVTEAYGPEIEFMYSRPGSLAENERNCAALGELLKKKD